MKKHHPQGWSTYQQAYEILAREKIVSDGENEELNL
jgi:hypothetical protein